MRTFYAKNRKEWRKWLEKNYNSREEIWLILYKKDSGFHSVNYEEAVEEALCYGWIDVLQKSRDENSYVQRFVPRKIGSSWSESNKKRARRLIAQGHMTDAGKKFLPDDLNEY